MGQSVPTTVKRSKISVFSFFFFLFFSLFFGTVCEMTLIFLNVFAVLTWATIGEGIRLNENFSQDDQVTGCCRRANCDDYRGELSKTRSGKTCKPWPKVLSKRHPNAALDSNFCRNPYGFRQAWCYINDPIHPEHWESCEIPSCNGEPEPKPEPEPEPVRGAEPEPVGKTCNNVMGWTGICQNEVIVGCGKEGVCWRQCWRASKGYCLPFLLVARLRGYPRCKSDQDCVDARAGFEQCPKGRFCIWI